ncbi:MAG: DUF91 domain-containing protein [Phycisphaerales bacterium]|nr:MAG: DUF91 domain-containing protein [Phycisphaerales bacterium]
MSEIKLFRITNASASEVRAEAQGLEKSLQVLIEKNLETFLGVRFLASEHATGRVHGGRIDTLGIDENGCPVIIEYKRAVSENVINQGLFYLDWLLDHKAEFKLLVLERFGNGAANEIDWSAPRLVCIAGDFTKYDEHSIRQINRNIDLMRYRKFSGDLIALELVSGVSAYSSSSEVAPSDDVGIRRPTDKPVSQMISEMDDRVRDLYESLRAEITALGDDVSEKQLKLYIAFRRIRNFATIVVQKRGLMLYLHLDPSTLDLDPSFMRDVSEIGHWGTGNLELQIQDAETLQRAIPFIQRAYAGG